MKFQIPIIFIIIFNLSLLNAVEVNSGFDENHWKESMIKSRFEKDEDFKTSPISPMSGLLRETIKTDENLYVYLGNGKIRFSIKKSDSPIISVTRINDKWFTVDGSGKKTERKISRETFKIDRFTFMCYPLEDRFILIAFDPERDMQKHFKNLLYYPPNAKFRVNAKIKRFEKVKKRVVKTSRDLEKTLIEYGKVHFSIDGKELSLLAFKFTEDKNDPDYKYLFLPFFDKTSENETYEGGRFLEVIENDCDEVIIDFNECYNPLCNYAHVYNCTLPPFENELDIRIEAGEKLYPH